MYTEIQLLTETIDSIFEDFATAAKIAGVYEEIFINPSKIELSKLPAFRQFKEVKLIIHNDDIYAWGSEEASYHMRVEKELNIPANKSVRLYYDRGTLIAHTLGGIGQHDPEKAIRIIKNVEPRLKTLLGKYREDFG